MSGICSPVRSLLTCQGGALCGPSPPAVSPHRCIRALKVGWRVCWGKAEEEDEQRYMAFLSHDISMLRLFETFLENTPQLTLLLYIILRTNKAELSQGEGSGAKGGDLGVRVGLDGAFQRGCVGAGGPSKTLVVSFSSHVTRSFDMSHYWVDPCPALTCPRGYAGFGVGIVEAVRPRWSFSYVPQERLRVR